MELEHGFILLKMAEATPLAGSKGSSRELPKENVKWNNLNYWVSCVCVVTFDLELGQAIEEIYPRDFPLSPQEKTNICYLAFPDSNSSQIGDSQFHFRIRRNGSGNGGCDFNCRYEIHGTHPNFMVDSTHYYGYSFFRQVRDKENKRGYFQKSVVVVSSLPYLSLFYELVKMLAPEYFENGLAALEAICHNIDLWPRPSAGKILSLPTMGNVIHLQIPTKSDHSSSVRALTEAVPRSPNTIIIPNISQINYYQLLRPVLAHFELLWELMVLCEPIVVIAPSPTLVAQAVDALVSLIRPLKYMSDYRPYFTIHDTEFRNITTKTQAPPAMVIGVTNPFFNKALDHWPHVLRLGEASHSTGKLSSTRGLYNRRSSGNVVAMDEGPVKPGLYTSYRPSLRGDRSLLKFLSTSESLPGKRPLEAQNVIIHKHILELTTSFVIPLERYLASLMPLKRDVLPWKLPPQLKEFNIENFLTSLDIHGPQLTSKVKGNWPDLYRRFFDTPNFRGWFGYRRQEANQKLRLLHLDLICKADVSFWMGGKEEVEIVDFLLRVKRCILEASNQHPSISQASYQGLKGQISLIISRLPEDLKAAVKLQDFVSY